MTDTNLVHALTQLKEGDTFEPCNSGKIFTKMGGLFVTQDMDAYNWMKANVDTDFFNTYVARIVFESRSRSRSALVSPS